MLSSKRISRYTSYIVFPNRILLTEMEYNLIYEKHICRLVAMLELKTQGDPNQNLLILMAITLKISISDPMLVQPKCVWEA